MSRGRAITDRRRFEACEGGFILLGHYRKRLGFMWQANAKWHAQVLGGGDMHSFNSEPEAEAWLRDQTKDCKGAFA